MESLHKIIQSLKQIRKQKKIEYALKVRSVNRHSYVVMRNKNVAKTLYYLQTNVLYIYLQKNLVNLHCFSLEIRI